MARARSAFALAVTLWLAAPLSHAVIVPPLPQPSWVQLSAEERRVLAPLVDEWDKMDGFRRKKWLGIAKRYQTLSLDEQARMQRRMIAWAKLTPEERKRARDQYKSLQKAPPEKKDEVKQKWQEYKELPDSEKARLKAAATQKPTPRPAPSKPVATVPQPAYAPEPAPTSPHAMPGLVEPVAATR